VGNINKEDDDITKVRRNNSYKSVFCLEGKKTIAMILFS
jgi:hypothetical protein